MFSVLLVYALVVPSTDACRTPQVPNNGKISFRPTTKTSPNEMSSYSTGMIAVYTCDGNFHLMGPRHRRCHDDGLWYPQSLPFCLSDVTGGLPAVQSSAYKVGGEAFFAVDGNRNTCTSTTVEESPWLAVHLEDVLPIAMVKIAFRYTTKPSAVYVTVRVGNSTRAYAHNAVCSVFKGMLPAGQSVYLLCPTVVHGRYVSIHLHGTASLSVCEFEAYSKAASLEKSLQTVMLQSFDYISPRDVLVRNNFMGVYTSLSSLIIIVLLVGVLAHFNRKCSVSSDIAEFPAVESETSDRVVDTRRISQEKLIKIIP
ncbi:unnamed protein product [Ixodes pacificus]